MGDKIKTVLALLFFSLSVTLPVIPLLMLAGSLLDVTWFNLNEVNPLWAGAGAVLAFVLPFALGALMLFWVRDPSWITVYLPYLFSTAYTFIPDLIPFSIDDAAAMSAGAIFSAWLAIRKNPNTPRWIFLPLLAAAIYTFFGGALPGPLDEALVDLVSLLIAGYGTFNSRQKGQVIEGMGEEPGD